MKRLHENEDKIKKIKKRKEVDLEILEKIQDKLTKKDIEFSKEIENAKKNYYIFYFRKVNEKISSGKTIYPILENFWRIFS